MEFFLSLLAEYHDLGDKIPCRKSWQTLHNFFYQFGNPNGGIIFDAMSGLCSVGQMALELGNWDVVAFEKDEATWRRACDVISNHIQNLNKKEKQMVSMIKSNVEAETLRKRLEVVGFDKLTEKEVRLSYRCCIVLFF